MFLFNIFKINNWYIEYINFLIEKQQKEMIKEEKNFFNNQIIKCEQMCENLKSDE